MDSSRKWKILSFFAIAVTIMTSTMLLQEALNVESLGLIPSAIAAVIAQPNTVNTAAIINGEVKNSDIANNAVTSAKIGSNAIDGSKILDGSINLADLRANSVDSSKIKDGTIVLADLGPGVAVSGPPGTPGSQLLTGTGLPPPTMSINGNIYINTANGDYYQDVAGVWFLKGNLKGPAGAAGSQFLTGTGLPPGEQAVHGNLYLDTASGDIYHSVSDAWSLVGNLKGDPGDDADVSALQSQIDDLEARIEQLEGSGGGGGGPVVLESIVPSDSSIVEDTPIDFTVSLSGPAASDTVITISPTNQLGISLPHTVTVQGGQTSVVFTVTPTEPGTLSVTAALDGVEVDTSVEVLILDNDLDSYSPTAGDCDDSDPAIHWNAPELSGDSVDNDCDGLIDEDLLPVGGLVINEISYRSNRYIEIYNPGTETVQLSGIYLQWILKTGFFNIEYPLTLGQSLAPGGYELVIPPGIDTADGTAWRIVDNAGGSTRIIDSVMYGSNVNSLGEGSPAPSIASPSGNSLIRYPNGVDTDDNSADFVLSVDVTFGSANSANPP